VIETLKKATNSVMDQMTSKDVTTKKIYEHYKSFRKGIEAWNSYDTL